MKRVIVCDSGLGGLNVAGRFFTAPGKATGEKCEIIYFNAYPARGSGFNSLPDPGSQEELFRVVLESMKKYSPDLCLIACNTLSIVYERLAAWYQPEFPVMGIVESAVVAMAETLAADPGSSLLILGTETTVRSGVYVDRLVEKGFDPGRISSLACPGLATMLETDPASGAVTAEVSRYAALAASKLSGIKGRLYLALCCTHYAFAGKLWLEKFSSRFPGGVALIDPNRVLAETCGFQAVDFSYLSRMEFAPGARENMSRCFADFAPEISGALLTAEVDLDLFPFEAKKTLRS